jgi:hypothetical protein
VLSIGRISLTKSAKANKRLHMYDYFTDPFGNNVKIRFSPLTLSHICKYSRIVHFFLKKKVLFFIFQ